MERLLHLQDSVQRLTTGPDNSAQTHRDDPVIKPINEGRVAESSEGQSGLENIIKMMEDSLQGLASVNGREKQPSHTGKLCFRDAQARYIRETFWAGLYEEVSVNPSIRCSN
jgi:hypothetical protein